MFMLWFCLPLQAINLEVDCASFDISLALSQPSQHTNHSSSIIYLVFLRNETQLQIEISVLVTVPHIILYRISNPAKSLNGVQK
jgi:hypothetical protein